MDNTTFKILINSLINLSKTYQEQVESFPEYVDVFDEVISDFDNAFSLIPTLMEENLIPYSAVKELIKCNNLINLNMSLEDDITDDIFANGNSWNLVREYAQNALEIIKNNAT